MASAEQARLGLLVVLALSGCADDAAEPVPAAAPPSGRARHVFVITIDTLRADRLGCYGYPRPLTPHLDGIAAAGTRFAEATTAIPCTSPSHASLFTGLYPLTHGLTNNFYPLQEGVETLAEILQRSGFETAAFFNKFLFDQARVVQGFETVHGDPGDHASGIVPQLARWLDASSGAPLFAWVHLFIPHAPNTPPPSFAKQWVTHAYEGPLDQSFETLESIRRGRVQAPPGYVENYRDGYDAEVAFSDARVGQVLDVLAHRGLLESSLVVVAADHGESLEPDVLGLHSPVIAQSTLRVPLLMRGPGVPAGRTVEEVVELVDVHPTLLELLGLPPAPDCQGQSLVPLLQGTAAGDGLAFSMLPTEYAGQEDAGGGKEPPALAVRSGRWKLVLRGPGEVHLYDLSADPEEREDRAAREPRVVATLRPKLEEWLREVRRDGSGQGPLGAAAEEFLRGLGYTVGTEDGGQ